MRRVSEAAGRGEGELQIAGLRPERQERRAKDNAETPLASRLRRAAQGKLRARSGAEIARLDVVYECPALQYTAYADASFTN